MVITMSWARATIAATDIFHSRKYAQMNSTTRIRKTKSPVRARFATWAPQLAPTSCAEMSLSASTPTDSAMALLTLMASRVAQLLGLHPDRLTRGVDDR